jgi:hypothetical protein
MRTDRPGCQYRDNKDGRVHYWNPKRAVKGAPAFLSTVRLPDGLTDEELAAQCQHLTKQLRAELEIKDAPEKYDGTIKSLIDLFRADTTSSLHTVKHSTRLRDYEPSLRVLTKNVGGRDINALRSSDFKRWYEQWRKKGHRRAAGAMKLLRLVISYGAGERLRGSRQAREILADMRFEQAAPRKVAMTYGQCAAIVRKSIELKCPSIGFVEAIKFETALRRIDVIGEWAPPREGGPYRWSGLMRKDLSKDLILMLKTSKTGAELARDLNSCPLVMEALQAYVVPDIGPVVLDEDTGKPYWSDRYIKKFSMVRKAAGVPDHVWSMDTRAGAVSEAIEATGSIEVARELATHSTTEMTKRYSLGNGLEASRKVSQARAESRSKTAE